MSGSFLLNQLNLSDAQIYSKLFKSAKSYLYPKAYPCVMSLSYINRQGDQIVNIKASEKGQALIMIALTAIGLFAFAALAIDGSMAFSDERHAQNAADTSVLAAALANIRGKNWNDTVSTARVRATSNGYDNNGTTNIVEVYLCSDANATCIALPAGAKPEEYIQVKITSHVKTYFATVIGRSEVINRVEAVAHAVPGYRDSIYGGNAVVGLNPHACKAVEFNGNADMILTGSGVYTNSDCTPNAFNNDSNSPGRLFAPCISTVGESNWTPGKVILDQPGCSGGREHLPAVSAPPDPQITCGAQQAQQTGNTLSPGNWNGAFPPNGVTNLQSGTYCVSNGNFQINGGDTLIGTDVTIYMINGFVKWNGGATIKLDAPDSGPYAGLLLYLPPTNRNDVTVNGNGDSHIVGSIWAPGSQIIVQGGGGQSGLQCQFVGDTVVLNGGSTTNIDYQARLTYQPPIPPAIEMTQ
jgi:Flp pilus assembly protein TadG